MQTNLEMHDFVKLIEMGKCLFFLTILIKIRNGIIIKGDNASCRTMTYF